MLKYLYLLAGRLGTERRDVPDPTLVCPKEKKKFEAIATGAQRGGSPHALSKPCGAW
jgi:hypothetical protein